MRPSLKFVSKGISLANPVDQMPPGLFPVLENVRVTKDGEIVVREGTNGVLNVGGGRIHSLHRMNNNVDSTFARISGIGTKLYNDVTEEDTGYSGSPLSLVPFRPNRSPEPWMYVGDSARMRKMKTDGRNYQMGVIPPSAVPVCSIAQPLYTFIGSYETLAGWSATGTASGLALVSRFSTTISDLLYDSGVSGWLNIIPVVYNQNLQPGATVTINGSEKVKIAQVRAAVTNTTIAAIKYDDETTPTGECSIVFTNVTQNLRSNSMITLGAELVRVEDVIVGQDGTPSIRCTTTGTHAAGEAVTGHASFRVYVVGTYAATQSLTGNVLSFAVADGTGYVSNPLGINLGSINGRQITGDDYVHVSVLIDDPAKLVEARAVLDIGDGSFTQNFLYKNIRPSDITSNVQGTLDSTVTQQIVVNNQTYTERIVTPTSGPFAGLSVPLPLTQPTNAQLLSTGSAQWTEVVFKVSDMVRAGTDQTVSLSTVAAIRFEFNASAAINVLVGSWWIGGTYGPDVDAVSNPLQYATRYLASETGAKSNPSPALITGLLPQREAVNVTLTPSTDPQVDTIQILRFGGGLNQWVVVANCQNLPGSYQDQLPTGNIQANEVVEFDNYIPFPVVDLAHTGFCDVVGTTVRLVAGVTPFPGSRFNTDWVAGTVITINGVACTLYASPQSEFQLRLTQSMGWINAAAFQIEEPLIAGKPLPAMWGFGGQGIGTFLFGVGDPYNQGFLRWCKGNNPDTASDNGNLEITSPSEPLINGLEYDSRCFVFSSERLFSIIPNFGTVNIGGVGENVGGQNGSQFSAQVVVSNAGLYARWGFCVTPFGLAWVGKDGIYLWGGGDAKNITDPTLYPLFPHDGVQGSVTNGFYPPDYTQPDRLRLSYAGHSLYFTYLDTNGKSRCLRFDFTHMGWFPYVYPYGADLIYQEEGEVNSVLVAGNDGVVYQMVDTDTDQGTKIACKVRTPAIDSGDSRAQKLYSDQTLMFIGDVTVQTLLNNFNLTLPAVILSSLSQSPVVFAADPDRLYRNIGLDISWAGTAQLFEYQPNYVLEPYEAYSFTSFPGNAGYDGFSCAKEAYVSVLSTAQATLVITVDGSDFNFPIPATGGKVKRFRIVLPPIKGMVWNYRANCPSLFTLLPDQTVVMMKPWGASTAFQPFRPFLPYVT
jgi:hypothetical protein